MKKLRTILAGLTASAALAVSMTSIGANATESYGYYQTPAMIADQWCKTPTISIAGSSNSISGGDFGVWWYECGVGLDTRFVRSTARTVDIELYEADAGGKDILTRRQTGHFSTKNGIYRPRTYSGGGVEYKGVVETDNIAEVYMRLRVHSVSGDSSTNIPAGMMLYEYWID